MEVINYSLPMLVVLRKLHSCSQWLDSPYNFIGRFKELYFQMHCEFCDGKYERAWILIGASLLAWLGIELIIAFKLLKLLISLLLIIHKYIVLCQPVNLCPSTVWVQGWQFLSSHSTAEDWLNTHNQILWYQGCLEDIPAPRMIPTKWVKIVGLHKNESTDPVKLYFYTMYGHWPLVNWSISLSRTEICLKPCWDPFPSSNLTFIFIFTRSYSFPL